MPKNKKAYTGNKTAWNSNFFQTYTQFFQGPESKRDKYYSGYLRITLTSSKSNHFFFIH